MRANRDGCGGLIETDVADSQRLKRALCAERSVVLRAVRRGSFRICDDRLRIVCVDCACKRNQKAKETMRTCILFRTYNWIQSRSNCRAKRGCRATAAQYQI